MLDLLTTLGVFLVGCVTLVAVAGHQMCRRFQDRLDAERRLRSELTVQLTRLECELLKAGVLQLTHRRGSDQSGQDSGWVVANEDFVSTWGALQQRGCQVARKDRNLRPPM